MNLDFLNLRAAEIREERLDEISESMIQRALERRRPAQWGALERTRQTIERRQRELRSEIAEREAELTNLVEEWDRTCDEADQILGAVR